MNYGEILKTAIGISWRNRYLWFFGVFAGGGGGFSVQFPFPGGGGSYDGSREASAASLGPPPVAAGLDETTIIALVVGGALLFLLLIFLSVLADGALTDSVAAIDRGEERGFRSTFRAGRANFWRVLRLGLVVLGISIVGLIVIGGPLGGIVFGVFAATEDVVARVATAVVIGLIALVLLIGLGCSLQIVSQYASRHLVLTRGRALESLPVGYRLYRAKLGPSIILFLISIGVAIVIAIGLVLAILLVGGLVFLPTILLALGQMETAAIATGIVAGVIVIPLFLAACGAVGTFSHSYWTIAYLRMTEPPAAPEAEAPVAAPAPA